MIWLAKGCLQSLQEANLDFRTVKFENAITACGAEKNQDTSVDVSDFDLTLRGKEKHIFI